MDMENRGPAENTGDDVITLEEILAEANLLSADGDEERLATAIKAICW